MREPDASNLDQGFEGALIEERQPGEADSWWWLLSLVLMAIGLYLLLTVHLLYDVVQAPALVWAAGFAVPVAFFIGAGLALGQEAGFGLREQVRAIPAVLLGSAPLGSRLERPSKVEESYEERLSDERPLRPPWCRSPLTTFGRNPLWHGRPKGVRAHSLTAPLVPGLTTERAG